MHTPQRPPTPAPLEALEPRQLFAAAPLSILALGDSITLGIGSIDQSYRKHLGDKLNANGIAHNFVGKLRDGRGYDNDHYSVQGARARDSYRSSNGTFRKSIVDALRQDNVLSKQDKPDVVLLHIGTNTINAANASRAIDELNTLLGDLTKYWRAGRFAPDVKVLLAKIIPGGRSSNSGVSPAKVVETNAYNARLQSAVNAMKDRAFAARITLVDFYNTDAKSLGLNAADLKKANTDNDRSVDWFNNLNEANPRATATANHHLMRSRDYLHPTALGYKVMGLTWFKALKNAGLLNRAPASKAPTPAPAPAPTPPPRLPTPSTTAVPAGFTVAATGNFDAKGQTDRVLWNKTTQETRVQLFNNGKVTRQFNGPNVDAKWWAVQRVTDLNADRTDDIIWKKRDGRIGHWIMNGTRVQLTFPNG